MDLFNIKSLFEQKENDPSFILKLFTHENEHYQRFLDIFDNAKKRKENKNG